MMHQDCVMQSLLNRCRFDTSGSAELLGVLKSENSLPREDEDQIASLDAVDRG